MPPAGKPPILPPRNPLADATRKVGKRDPLPYYMAVERWQEKRRLERVAGPVKAALLNGVAIGAPASRKDIARKALTGLQAGGAKSRRIAENAIRKAKERAADEARRAAEAAERAAMSDAAFDGRSKRPPRPEPGRYGGLKDEQPG